MTTPQANAAADVSKIVQQILDTVKHQTYGNQAIMNAITGLQGSSASATSVTDLQTSVNDLQDDVTDLSEKVDALSSNVGAFQMLGPYLVSTHPSNDEIICTSDYDFKLYIHIRDDSDNDNDIIFISGSAYFGNADYDVVIGGKADNNVSLHDVPDGDTGALAKFFIETAKDATAECHYI